MSKKITIIFFSILVLTFINGFSYVEAKKPSKNQTTTTECVLLTGKTINEYIMNLAGTETAQILSGDIVTQNSTVKAIKRASEKSTTARKIVNISESTAKPVYMWYDGTTGTIYWYSETVNPIMNSNSRNLFANLVALEDIRSVADWDASRITSTMHMFMRCFHLTDLTGVHTWKTTSLVDMCQTFFRYYEDDDPNYKMTNLDALANWDVSHVRNMYGVFYGLQYITSLEALENWDTSNVTDLSYAFMHLHNLETLKGLENWNTSKVKKMYNTFSHLRIVTDISAVANWDTSSVEDLGGTWRSCRRLQDITPLANWDTSNVKIMGGDNYWGGTFSYDDNIVDFSPLSNWNVSNVTDMRCLFEGCTKMELIDHVANWNVSNVAKFDRMFIGCGLIKDASVINNWNIRSGMSFVNMFTNRVEIYPEWPDGTWEAGTFLRTVFPDINDEIGETDDNQSETIVQTTNSRYTFDLKAKAIFDQKGNKVTTDNNLYLTVLTQKKIDNAVSLLNMAEVKIISTNSKSKTIVVEGITL